MVAMRTQAKARKVVSMATFMRPRRSARPRWTCASCGFFSSMLVACGHQPAQFAVLKRSPRS